MASRSVTRQIEASADHYGPHTYLDLLTYYHHVSFDVDPADGEFFPMSMARGGRANKDRILFAIGVLPPAADVTGRLLDRTASISSIEGADFPPATNNAASSQQGLDNGVVSADGNDRAALVADTQFWINYAAMCKRLGVDPFELAKVITHESAWHPNAVAVRGSPPRAVAKGLTQFLRTIGTRLGGMTTEQWDDMESMSGREQLIYIEPYLKKIGVKNKNAGQIYAKNFGGLNLPGFGRGYMSRAKFYSLGADQQQAIAEAIMKQAKWSPEMMFKAYDQNKWGDTSANYGNYPGFNDGIVGDADLVARVGPNSSIFPSVFAAITDAVAAIDSGVEDVPFDPDAGTSDSWATQGSANAEQAQIEGEKLEGSPLLSGVLGQTLLAEQAAYVKSIQDAVNRMARTPPLSMIISPSKFGVKGDKITQDGNWSRTGPIKEFWGDQTDKISASGKVAGFMAMDVQNATGPGLTRWARNYSAGWQNFQSLVSLYRNNGGVYLPTPPTNEINLVMLGSVYIYYDGVMYIGSFDSLNITESDTTPFSAEYNFEFTVRASFLLETFNDDFQYGSSNLFATAPNEPVPPPHVSNIPESDPESNLPKILQPGGRLLGGFVDALRDAGSTPPAASTEGGG